MLKATLALALLFSMNAAQAEETVKSEEIIKCSEPKLGLDLTLRKQRGVFDLPNNAGTLFVRALVDLTMKGEVATTVSKPNMVNMGGTKRVAMQIGELRLDVYPQTVDIIPAGRSREITIITSTSSGKMKSMQVPCAN